jgi:hypothetical protein
VKEPKAEEGGPWGWGPLEGPLGVGCTTTEHAGPDSRHLNRGRDRRGIGESQLTCPRCHSLPVARACTGRQPGQLDGSQQDPHSSTVRPGDPRPAESGPPGRFPFPAESGNGIPCFPAKSGIGDSLGIGIPPRFPAKNRESGDPIPDSRMTSVREVALLARQCEELRSCGHLMLRQYMRSNITTLNRVTVR